MHSKKFSMLFLFNFALKQILNYLNSNFYFLNSNLWNSINIQTISLVLSLKILAEIVCVIIFNILYLFWRHHSPATEKKLQASWNFFQSHEWNKNVCSCATTDTRHAQRSIFQSCNFQSFTIFPLISTPSTY